MRILIVGGGLGGIALAAFLDQRRIPYRLVDRSPDSWRQGYSLGVWSNTRALFQQLNLADEFAQIGQPIHHYHIRDHTGQRLKNYTFDDFQARYGMTYTAVNRARLHALLACRANPAHLRWDQRVLRVQPAGDTARVLFHDDTAELFDLVIGADGVHSTVRASAFGPNLARFTGWRAWYAWIDKHFAQPHTMTEYLGPGRCVAMFDDPGPRALGVFFAACPPGQRQPQTLSPADHLRSLFRTQAPAVQAALANVADDDFMPTDLATVRLRHWVNGPVALLGDAAHAFEPHTGLGASMAMEDASVLAAALQRMIAGRQSLAAALADYQRHREPAIALARRINRHIRPFAFIRSRLLRWGVNQVIPLMPRGPFVRDYFRLFDSDNYSSERSF